MRLILSLFDALFSSSTPFAHCNKKKRILFSCVDDQQILRRRDFCQQSLLGFFSRLPERKNQFLHRIISLLFERRQTKERIKEF